MRKRNNGINIRVTDQEKKRIERYAKKCRLTVSEYLRKLANGYEPAEIPSDNFYTLTSELMIMIDFFKGQDDEKLSLYIKGLVSDLNRIYVLPKVGENRGNNKNMAD